MTGQVPAAALLRRCGAPSRRPATGPGTRCSRSGENRTYLGVDVYEGAYTYRGMHIVPGWGGSMFEELMPDVFVPESSWAPRSLGPQPPAARPRPARARPRRGRLRLLGLLAVEQPAGWLPRVRGRPAGPQPDGYLSDIDENDPDFMGTNYDVGFGDCRDGDEPEPRRTATVSSRRTRRSWR